MVIETLAALKGVRHVGIYKNAELISSNFPEAMQQAMLNSSEVIQQLFLALESVEKTHNEIFFAVNGGYLAGFKLHAGHIAVLLTDKKLNFPMISMGIKSASERLKQASEYVEPLELSESVSPVATTVTESEVPTDEEIIPVINQYVFILTEFLGPAASLVVEDAVDEWKQTYVQSPNNLTYLVGLLLNELDTTEEKQSFKNKADKVTPISF